jgi:hypothetical protein
MTEPEQTEKRERIWLWRTSDSMGWVVSPIHVDSTRPDFEQDGPYMLESDVASIAEDLERDYDAALSEGKLHVAAGLSRAIFLIRTRLSEGQSDG